MDSLRERLEREIARRKLTATDATQGAWHFGDGLIWAKDGPEVAYGVLSDADGLYMIERDPADALTEVEHWRSILQRHMPEYIEETDMVICKCCGWDLDGYADDDTEVETTDHCPDVEALAKRLGVTP